MRRAPVTPRARPKAQNENSRVRRSATIGLPRKSSAVRGGLPAVSARSAALAPSISSTGTRIVNSDNAKLGSARVLVAAAPASCAAIGLIAGSVMRGATHAAKIGPASAAVGNPTSTA